MASAFESAHRMVRHRQQEERERSFLRDYPTVLYAMSASLHVGLPPHDALCRAVQLLGPDSPVRREVEQYDERLRCGVTRQEALEQFAQDVALPEVRLFRSALDLVSDHGGRFGPTLERLASVARLRSSLMSAAKVATTNMRITAQVLLVVIPVVIATLSARIPDYWSTLLNHELARFVGGLGCVCILGGLLTLRRMSDFRP